MPLEITGFSQGPASRNTSAVVNMEVFCAYADYTNNPTWVSVATASNVSLTSSATTGYISIPNGVIIPPGAIYGFWVGRSDGGLVQYTNGSGTSGCYSLAI